MLYDKDNINHIDKDHVDKDHVDHNHHKDSCPHCIEKEKCQECLYCDKHSKYDKDAIRWLRWLYVIAIVFWLILIIWCKLYVTDLIGWIFLSIPIIIFGINLANLEKCTQETEEHMFDGNFLSFGFLIATILINWDKTINKIKLFKIMVIALIMLMFSLIDIWVPKKYMIVEKHFRTILQTLSLFILAYILYQYYLDVYISCSSPDSDCYAEQHNNACHNAERHNDECTNNNECKSQHNSQDNNNLLKTVLIAT